jgi:hypothetical protein
MKPLLYLETTIPSYLTSKPSRDLIVAARQRTTLDWWLKRQHDFQVFVSQIVLDEAGEGDRQAATARLSAIETVPLLAVNDEVRTRKEISWANMSEQGPPFVLAHSYARRLYDRLMTEVIQAKAAPRRAGPCLMVGSVAAFT